MWFKMVELKRRNYFKSLCGNTVESKLSDEWTSIRLLAKGTEKNWESQVFKRISIKNQPFKS